MAGKASIENGKKGGRPKGSTTRPQIRNYFSEEDVENIVEMLKTHMVDDMQLLKFVSEQIFGKATQNVEMTGADGGPIQVQGVEISVRKS